MHTETLGVASSTSAMLTGRVGAPWDGACPRHDGDLPGSEMTKEGSTISVSVLSVECTPADAASA
jgi:hypothetical protein